MSALRGKGSRLKAFLQRYGGFFLAGGMILVALFFSLQRIFNVNFVCTNGDYQNYNALRRVLAGQIPYRDFANYLGMGAILLQAPLLRLHNSFAASLFVSHFVAAICFMLLVYLIFYLVTGHKLFSGAAALLLPKLVEAKLFTLIPAFGIYTDYHLGLLAKPNNSMRIVRLFLPVLYCLIALGVLRWRQKRGRPAGLRALVRTPKNCAVLGLAVGLGMTWSNDFGFAAIGSATLILIVLAAADKIEKQPRPARRFLGYFPALLVGMAFSILLASGGHPGDYFRMTRGIASWQFWYFGYDSTEKIYGLSQLFADGHFVVQFVFYLGCMAWCLWRLLRKRESDRLILFVFLYTSIFAAQCVYILGGGGNDFQEGTADVVILSFWALVLWGVLWLAKRVSLLPGLRAAAGVLAGLYVGFMAFQDVSLVLDYRAQKIPEQTEYYLAELGGVSSAAEALRQMQRQVGGEPLFSTYATALDDMRGEFQPTGCDYIIHALGERQFEEYVADFSENKYPYVQTTNFRKWLWEPWTVNASWDLYRELFSNYRRQGDYDVWSLWEYQGEDANVLETAVQLTVEQVDEDHVTLTVTGEEQRPCYVDVTLSWENQWVNNGDRFTTWNRAVFVFDDSQKQKRGGAGEGYYRPAKAQGQHLMIFMDRGAGSITLSGQPEACTRLQVRDAAVEKVILYQG